jgi:sortase A
MNRAAWAACVGIALLLPGSGLLARAAYVRVNGAVGVSLIDRALDRTLEDGVPRAPWSRADMHPLARLTVPRLHVSRAVMSNASGGALAFALGRIDGTAEPGACGNCVIAGHRDSWASFLERLRPGDEIDLTVPARRAAYRVRSAEVVPASAGRVLAPTSDDRLTLVTCWPFRGWLHSPWRYVVVCEPVSVGYFSMTPQATRPPAFPVGWVVKSSGFAWMISE